LELGLKYVKEARGITDLPIIACGGISTAEDVKRYKKAGANFFGIGVALTGMNTEEIKAYFHELLRDLEKGKNNAFKFLKENWRMKYKKYELREKKFLTDDLFLLKLNGKMNIEPGQFVFAWLPEKGEKPFSVLDDEPISLLVKMRGYFTKELSKLQRGDILYLRGPYGSSPKIKGKSLLVGGGTGIAALYLFTKRNEGTIALLGGKDKNSLAYLEKFQKRCEKVYLATESGELGHRGLVTEILEEVMKKSPPEYCLNCGPKEMVKGAIQIETKYLNPEKIYSSIDFLTRCGVGLCGSCTTSKGYRNCVDGTFLKPNQI
jgi:dihydroorotate dehydrogenase (NAD+) catalytic subunit